MPLQSIRRTASNRGSVSEIDDDTYVSTDDVSTLQSCYRFICDPPRVAWFLVGFLASASLFFMRSNGFDSISWLEVFIPLFIGSIVYTMFPFMILCMIIGACTYRATLHCANKFRDIGLCCCCTKPKLKRTSVLPVYIANTENSPSTTLSGRARSKSLPDTLLPA